jgi:ectoine hydroxylase-related dioxygenase (phytanoyl-CoA dioxygenase family)
MTGLTRLQNTADHATMMEAFNRDGGMIVENLFPADVITRMGTAVKLKAESSQPGSKSPEALWKNFHGEKTIRFTGLGMIEPAFFEMLANPILQRIADDVLLSQFGSYWLNTGQTMIIGPGEPAQYLHRDCTNWTAYCRPLWPNCPEITVSTMIALEDMTEELGGTRVIPGSHLWEDIDRAGEPAQTVATEMPAGSGMIYSGKVIHGGGANRTKDRWRFAMHISFPGTHFSFATSIGENSSDARSWRVGFRFAGAGLFLRSIENGRLIGQSSALGAIAHCTAHK